MNYLFLTLAEMQSIFMLFFKLIILFTLQELLTWLVKKVLKNKYLPKLINFSVYTSFIVILVWYANSYILNHFTPFVKFFTR